MGAMYLQEAVSYIMNASNLVGGRIIYLDCASGRKSYYERLGFQYLQNKQKSDLIQMYKVI